MLRSGALRSTDSELVQACIKGLTSLFALHNNRLAVRADARIQSKERQAMKEINDIMPNGVFIAIITFLTHLVLFLLIHF